MSSGLTLEAKRLVLSVFSGEVTVGLQRDGFEVSDSGYLSQLINLGELVSGEEISIVNLEDTHFGPWQEDAPFPITSWFIQRNNQILAKGEFSEPRRPLKGDELVLRSGSLALALRSR